MPWFYPRLDFRESILVPKEEETFEMVFSGCIGQILNFHVETTIFNHFDHKEFKFSPHDTPL